MSKGAYNIGREVGEVGILERDSGEESGGRWRQTGGKTGASLSRKRGHGCRFSGDRDSPSLCTRRPWDLLLENGNSRLEERGMNPGSRILEIGQQRIGWIKRRGKGEIKTAERPRTGRKSGELKRLRLFLPPETKDASSVLWLGFRKLITIRGVGGLTRNRIGDPGKNFIRRGRRSGASRSLLTGA